MFIDGILYLIVFAILTIILLVAISVLKNEKIITKLSKKVRKK